ncbi:MAG: pyridoxal-phosphate dependent enzyme [Rhodobacteraceae bacterium]|nr:pyridoxal-phosphate dependent enzyme [Paracoccaceae bacterium]
MSGPYASILDTVGNTPVVRINNLAPEGVEIYAKLEAFNPLGSVKDRLALGVIEAAERDGSLKPGQTVVEATSGNTGIGLAMVCAQKGYPLVVVMAENFSVERRKLLRFLGARVVLTPASEKGTGMVAKAKELAETHGWFLTRQFDNPANAEVHERTTAAEILADFGPNGLDYLVTGFGTGGTINGIARRLKAESPATRIVAAEPDNSAILASGIAQDFGPDGSARGSHPAFRPHLMQGWSPDFISPLANEVLQAGHIDRFQPVPGESALRAARDLARREGIFCGISGGATFAAALEVARSAEPGAKILAMIPDTGERYLTTPLFADIGAEMDDEEAALSRSTPGYRFDTRPAPAPATTKAPAADQATLAEVEEIISTKPVVLFALEWCEFCWSVRRMFDKAGIDYDSVDLDSVAMQAGDKGGRYRAALREITGQPTIPQIFVGGQHVGGATETFDAFNSGQLQAALLARSIGFDTSMTADAYSFLPSWLHPR